MNRYYFFSLSLSFHFLFPLFFLFFPPPLSPFCQHFGSLIRRGEGGGEGGREFEADTEIALRYIVNFAINPARPRAQRYAETRRSVWTSGGGNCCWRRQIFRALVFSPIILFDLIARRWQLSIFPINVRIRICIYWFTIRVQDVFELEEKGRNRWPNRS